MGMHVTPMHTLTSDGRIDFSVHSTEKLDQSGSNMCNVYSSHTESIILQSQEAVDVPTGIYLTDLPIPLYCCSPDVTMYIGFHVLTSIVNIGFSGELEIRVLNTNVLPVTILPGDLLGQLIYIKS